MSGICGSNVKCLLEKEEKRKNGQDFADDLMSRSIDETAANMTFLKQLHRLDGGTAVDVVVRSCTIPIWKDCLDIVDMDHGRWLSYRLCAVGTPGVGKTTSTIVLIYMLLKQEKTVLYHLRGSGWIYEFQCTKMSPANETEWPRLSCSCSVYEEHCFPYGIPSTNDDKVYYIVDSNGTMDSCSPHDEFKAKVIILSPPSKLHRGGGFTKGLRAESLSSGGFVKYYPLWTLDELLEARDCLNASSGTNLDEHEVKRRFHYVGGIPRNLFCNDIEYAQALHDQADALAILTAEDARLFTIPSDCPIVGRDEDQRRRILMGYQLRQGDTSFDNLSPCLVSWALKRQVYEIHLDNI